MQPLNKETDFYMEAGKIVFTEKYLLERGYCCGSGCRHCPFNFITSSNGHKEKINTQVENDKTFRAEG